MSQQSLQPRPSTGFKGTRGRSGCLNCRARKKKCEESKPTCSRCSSFGDDCRWDDGFTFRTIALNGRCPNAPRREAQNASNGSPAFRIIHVDVENSYKRRKVQSSRRNRGPADGHPPGVEDVSTITGMGSEQVSPLTTPNSRKRLPSATDESPDLNMGHLGTVAASRATSSGSIGSGTSARRSPAGVVPLSRADTQDTNTTADRNNHPLQQDDLDLGALDFLTSHTSNIDMIASAVQIGDLATWIPESLDATYLSGNGADPLDLSSSETGSTHYPSAAYRELHSTLHQHMVQTARATALNKQVDPRSTAGPGGGPDLEIRQNQEHSTFDQRKMKSKALLPAADGSVTPRRQLHLWQNYLGEIAPWLDMFDTKRHFQSTIPHMAKKADHLNFAVLALSARQLERRSTEKLYTESLRLYQRALNIIVPRLQDLETEVIASCVILCVLEMMSSSPKAWARHVNGCAMLLEAAGINGVVGGVRQAIFWCFARMDLWGGYLSDTVTKIPTNRWFLPSDSMASAVSQLKSGSGVDTYANYAVFLCASVVNVISTQEMRQTKGEAQITETPNLYATRWKALYDLLEDWHGDRPEELLPLMVEQASLNDSKHPFPIVLYATTPGINGNQMYHAAALLMLQHKPKGLHLPKPRKSMLWHARQICGIATSNADHNAWTNALQPIWMAGKIMSHPSEHDAILDILQRIEKETGFATQWRANDLKDYWGDGSD